MTKVAVLGGGTGMSILLRGLKELPFDISAIVSVCDDGCSTGRLREEFNTLAVGDIRKVLISLSGYEEVASQLLDYRFNTSSDLDGHALGNLLLIAANDIMGNMSGGIELIDSLLDLKGKVIPLTLDNVVLMGEMKSGKIIAGEHNITENKEAIKRVYYKEKPSINSDVLKAIREADAIILSMGSLFTSIIPNLICEEVINELDNSSSKIIYVCNIMTQPGETDNFSVTDHINLLNSYLGRHKIDAVVVNNGYVSPSLLKIYETAEQKDLVLCDLFSLNSMGIDVIQNDYILIQNNYLRHDALHVSIDILSYLLRK